MPRTTIQLDNKVESLSVVSPECVIDAAVEPRLPDADLRKLYKFMLATRLFDERLLALQRQGRIGTYGPTKGQEAASLGVAYTLKPEDWLVPSFRETAAMLWRGWPMVKIVLWWGGHEEGSVVPEGVNDLPICVPVGSQCQHAMGIAWGAKLRNDGSVAACFLGDGATSEGDFHEAMNFAAVYRVPCVFVIQNNHWAISIPREKQTASKTLAQKAIAYGMDGIQVDGNDLLSVIVASTEAVAKARKGGGPTLIEAVTYRLAMHTTADDPKKYRKEEDVKGWECKDPLPRFRNYLLKKNLLNDKVQQLIEEEIDTEIRTAIEHAERYEVDPYGMFKYMYAEMTPDLKRQMEELRDYLEGARPQEAPAGGVSRVM